MRKLLQLTISLSLLGSSADAGTRELAQELFKFASVCGGAAHPIFSYDDPSPRIAQTAFRYEAGMLRITVSGFRSYVNKRVSCTVTMYASPRNFGHVAFHTTSCAENGERNTSVEAAIKRDINEFHGRIIEQIDYGLKHSGCLC
jgi:hypothetical protein